MKTETLNEQVAKFDFAEYLYEQIEYFKNDKSEFLVSIWGDEESDESTVTDKDIEQHFLNDYYLSEHHFYDFENEIESEFHQHIGKKAYVKGRLMTWRNLDGIAEFDIEKAMDIYYKIVPNTDLTYDMKKIGTNEYEVIICHHDSPMGEFYNIKIIDLNKH